MKQGGGFEEGVVLGPLIEGAAVDKVEEHIQDAVAKGAKIAYGGQRLTDMGPNFYRPTVLTGASPDLKIFREETRSEKHTSELQPLMRISYAVSCLKKKERTSFQAPTRSARRSTRLNSHH